jgi:hypothetical protein
MKKTTIAGILSLLIAAPAAGAEIITHPNVPFIGAIITIAGVLELGDDEKFDAATSSLPPSAIVFLNSGGGHNDPAIKIGQTVRARRYATIVGDGVSCTSACVLIWLSGVPRYFGETAKLGVHSASTSEGKRNDVGNELIAIFYRYMGAPQEMIDLQSKTKPSAVKYLGYQQLLKWGLLGAPQEPAQQERAPLSLIYAARESTCMTRSHLPMMPCKIGGEWSVCMGDDFDEFGQMLDKPNKNYVKPSCRAATADHDVTVKCAGFKVVPPELIDSDPVVATFVHVAIVRDQLHAFEVKHATLGGDTFDRTTQYRDIRMWSDRSGDYWSGVSIKNPRRTMVGQLGFDGSRGIAARRYIEKLFVGRKLERTTTSVCVEEE